VQSKLVGVERLDLFPTSLYKMMYTIYVPYVISPRTHPRAEVTMFEDKAKVLLMVPQEVLDRARGFAGEATTKLKRPVSLQMVLRALIDEGLKRNGDKAVLVNIEAQVQAVRQIRSRAGREGSGRKDQRVPQSGVRRTMSRRMR
jgi:hypothetical protein